MSPDVHFNLDCQAFDECIRLLAASEMKFVEESREHYDPMPFGAELSPECDRIRGKLISAHGSHSCYLQSRGSRYQFIVTLEFGTAVLDSIESAFAGHVVKPLRATKT